MLLPDATVAAAPAALTIRQRVYPVLLVGSFSENVTVPMPLSPVTNPSRLKIKDCTLPLDDNVSLLLKLVNGGCRRSPALPVTALALDSTLQPPGHGLAA